MLIVMADLLGRVGRQPVLGGDHSRACRCRRCTCCSSSSPPSSSPRSRRRCRPTCSTVPKGQLVPLLLRAFFPPVFLIGTIKLSILLGWATPSEAGAVGAAGAIVLAALWGRLNVKMMNGVCQSAAQTISMVFFIIISATCFAFVYRAARRRRHRRALDQGSGPRQLGLRVPGDGDRVLPRLLPRLDRDHADRAAGVRAAHQDARLRRPRAAGRHRLLVPDPAWRSTCRPRSSRRRSASRCSTSRASRRRR